MDKRPHFNRGDHIHQWDVSSETNPRYAGNSVDSGDGPLLWLRISVPEWYRNLCSVFVWRKQEVPETHYIFCPDDRVRNAPGVVHGMSRSVML